MDNDSKFRTIINTMYKEYPKITYMGIGAVVRSVLCLAFKCVPGLDVSYDWMRVLGDFLLNVAISIIAAVIFFIFQVVIPNNMKHYTMSRIMYNSIQERIIIQFYDLVNEVRLFTELSEMTDISEPAKEKTEESVKTAIKNKLILIKDNIDNCIKLYFEYIPDDILDTLERIKYSTLIDRVTLYDDYSDLEERVLEIKPLLESLMNFDMFDDLRNRNTNLIMHSISEALNNNMQTIEDAYRLSEEEKNVNGEEI